LKPDGKENRNSSGSRLRELCELESAEVSSDTGFEKEMAASFS